MAGSYNYSVSRSEYSVLSAKEQKKVVIFKLVILCYVDIASSLYIMKYGYTIFVLVT